jgi:hypothetical protein
MSIFWIFFFIIAFCLYILFGLYVTEGITKLSTLIFTWVIYTCLWLTFVNVFMLGYFWSTIRKKRGPTGVRGPEGEDGTQGIDGSCSITSAQAVLLQQLTAYIDNLYREKTGKSILNQELQKFPCTYLNNKIKTQAGSRQYSVIVATLSNQNKPVIDIINYVKSIWKVWFDLIYNANPKWFEDEYADEDYSWTGANPFTEIKKYDIFYWGITRSFRPLKAEICRSNPNYESSKLPIKPQARLKVIQSNDYMKITDDYKTGGNPDASWWRAKSVEIGEETYYPVGDIITAGGRRQVYWNLRKNGPTIVGDMQFETDTIGPDIRSILVSGDVKDPIKYDPRWIGGRNRITTARPVCPDGYVSMGDVINYSTGGGNDNPANYPIKCVPADCVENNNKRDTGADTRVWTQRMGINVLNHFNWGKYDANGDNGYNMFRSYYGGPYYRLKEKCLVPQSPPATKEPESEFAELGVGWFGHPYKLDPRYSIFTFLNLVPEGMIVHKTTGRRFYIIHYGGEDVNVYNVLEYSATTDKFDNGLQVSSNANNAKVEPRPLSRRDERQQWYIVLQTDKRFLKLKSLFSNRYLYLGLEPITGDAQFSTIDLDFNNYKANTVYSNELSEVQFQDNSTFSFISAYGTQMDIIDKANDTQLTVKGKRIRISSQTKQPLNLFGVFVYNKAGTLYSMNARNASSSSVYQGRTASKALRIVSENSSRNINQAIAGANLLSKVSGWNNWEINGAYCMSTNKDGKASTGGDWWEYKFNNAVEIAAIEVIGRVDCCPERMANMLIEIYNDGVHSDPVWDDNTGTDPIPNATKLFIIEKNGVIHHTT